MDNLPTGTVITISMGQYTQYGIYCTYTGPIMFAEQYLVTDLFLMSCNPLLPQCCCNNNWIRYNVYGTPLSPNVCIQGMCLLSISNF